MALLYIYIYIWNPDIYLQALLLEGIRLEHASSFIPHVV